MRHDLYTRRVVENFALYRIFWWRSLIQGLDYAHCSPPKIVAPTKSLCMSKSILYISMDAILPISLDSA